MECDKLSFFVAKGIKLWEKQFSYDGTTFEQEKCACNDIKGGLHKMT